MSLIILSFIIHTELCQVKGNSLQTKDEIKLLSKKNRQIFQPVSIWWCHSKVFCLSIFYGGGKMGRIDFCEGMMGLRDYRFNFHLLVTVSCWVSSYHEVINPWWLCCSLSSSVPTAVVGKRVWEAFRPSYSLQDHKDYKREEEGKVYMHRHTSALKWKLIKVPSDVAGLERISVIVMKRGHQTPLQICWSAYEYHKPLKQMKKSISLLCFGRWGNK